MINKKLLSFDRGALRYVGANVAFQWLGMLCNVIFVRAIAQLVGAAFAGSLTSAQLWQNLVLCLATVPMRFAFTMLASAMSDQASKDVKRTLRSSIYAKLARLGPCLLYTSLVLHQARRLRHSGRYRCAVVPAGLRLRERCLRHGRGSRQLRAGCDRYQGRMDLRSEEHTSELQSQR